MEHEKIHRIILTSETWKRSASNLNADPKTISFDKENKFLLADEL